MLITAPLEVLRWLNRGARRSSQLYSLYFEELAPVTGVPLPDDPRKTLHLYGRLVRTRRPPPQNMRTALLSLGSAGPLGMTQADHFEWCLFLFSEKDWTGLAIALPRAFEHGLGAPARRAVLHDLAWLCVHRLRIHGECNLAQHVGVALKRQKGFMSAPQARFLETLDEFIAHHPFGSRAPMMEAVKTYRPHFALSAVNSLMPTPEPDPRPLEGQYRFLRSSSQAHVLVVSADKSYADKYLNLFANHLFEIAPDLGLHLCAAGFHPDLSRLDRRIGVSVRDIPDLGNEWSTQRAFFASLRYLDLGDLLDRYESLRVTDLDGIVLPGVAERPVAPVCLHSRVTTAPRPRLPFEMVSAAGVGLLPSEDARAFVSYLVRYLTSGFRHLEEPLWYIDQNALYCAWQDLRDDLDIRTDLPPFFRQGGGWSLIRGEHEKIEFMTRT